MKQLAILTGYTVLLLGFSGCQNPGQVNSSKASVEVIIEGDGEFPEFLVGVWKADKGGWEFVFEPNGTISSVVISLGRIRLTPGQVTEVPMKRGGKGIFEPGQWLIHYVPASRELTVKISLKNFYAEIGKGILEGKSTDVFIGKIDEDGKTWHVDWTNFPDYVARTDKYPNRKMFADPNYSSTKTLTLEKVIPE